MLPNIVAGRKVFSKVNLYGESAILAKCIVVAFSSFDD
jgi:hypothetical protein